MLGDDGDDEDIIFLDYQCIIRTIFSMTTSMLLNIGIHSFLFILKVRGLANNNNKN